MRLTDTVSSQATGSEYRTLFYCYFRFNPVSSPGTIMTDEIAFIHIGCGDYFILITYGKGDQSGIHNFSVHLFGGGWGELCCYS